MLLARGRCTLVKNIVGERTMALEKKPLVRKNASTSAPSKSKGTVKKKMDTAKPAATKVATALRVPIY
jgi:hypothetical protein